MSSHAPAGTRASGPRFLWSRRSLCVVAALYGAACLAAALYLQHRQDMLPCAWCVLQRLQVIVVVALALLAAGLPGVAGRVTAGLGALVALSGLGSALYQQFYAANDLSCSLSLADRIVGSLGLADRWPSVFEAQAMCNEANLPWFGVPFAVWAALMFVLLAGLLAVAGLRGDRR